MLEGKGWGKDLDLNFALGATIEVSDDDDDNMLWDIAAKRRKPNSRKSKGETSAGVQEIREEEGQREMDVVVEAEVPNVPAEPDYALIINRRSGRRKKNSKKKDDGPVLIWEVLELEHDRWVAQNLEKDLDLVNHNEMATETLEASDDLIIPLLRYQKEWLAWALKQEESVIKGGILADEMGMGKTLQAIALVLLKRKLLKEFAGQLPSSLESLPKDLPAIKGTLVICPLVAVMQWVGEIERFTSKGSTKVLVYHGANRAKHHYQFSEYDFVLTTYSIVEAEFRKYVMPPKEKCQYCGKLFYDHKLKIHLKYFCGPGAARTAKQSKQQKKEPKQKSVGDFEVGTSEAGLNEGNMCDLGDKEMERVSSTRKSILHSVVWERVILDEVSTVFYHLYIIHSFWFLSYEAHLCRKDHL